MLIIPPGQSIQVKIEDATFTITPLSAQQRQEIIQLKKTVSGEIEADPAEMAKKALKLGLKDAKGLMLPDGSEFKLNFEDGQLCDEHCQLLIDSSTNVYHLGLKMSQGLIHNSPGVEIVSTASKKTSTKKKG